MAALLVQQMKQINIDVNIKGTEIGTFASIYNAGTYDWFLNGRGMRGDVDGFVQEFHPASATFKIQTPAYRNLKAWRAIGNGRIQLDDAKRRPMYKDAQEALWDNPIQMPLVAIRKYQVYQQARPEHVRRLQRLQHRPPEAWLARSGRKSALTGRGVAGGAPPAPRSVDGDPPRRRRAAHRSTRRSGSGRSAAASSATRSSAIESDLTATVLVLRGARREGGDCRSRPLHGRIAPRRHSARRRGRRDRHAASRTSCSTRATTTVLPRSRVTTPDWYDERVQGGVPHDAAAPDRRGCGGGGRPPAAGPDRLRLGREHDRRLPTRDPRRRDVLGEVPDHPIDPSVGVIRVDDLDGNPIAVAFRYSAHPVTVGQPLAGRLRGLPRPGPGGARAQPRRPRPLPPRLRRQHQPPRRHRLRSRLPRHQEPRRPRTRRRSPQDRRRHPHQHPRRTNADPLGNVPNILFTPWEPVHGNTCTHLAATETTIALDYVDLPSLDDGQ